MMRMDYQSLIQLMTSKTLIKKVTPFLLSISVFSFIFSSSSWHSFLFRFFKFYFSSLPMQLLNHALDKSWIFLVCNGILVIIANTSGMVLSPSGYDLNDLLQKKIGDGLQAPPDTKDTSLEVSEPENAVPEVEGEEKENDATEEGGGGEDECLAVEQEENSFLLLDDDENDATEEEGGGGEDECLAVEQEENSCLILDDDEEQEQESGFLKTGGGGEGKAEAQELKVISIRGDEEDSEICFMIEPEEDQEQLYDDEEGIDKLSTEELNKKFDDFIRKMKEELRIEAQQQLVLVK